MKKWLSIIALSAMVSTAAYADFVRVEMGAGAFMAEPSGDINYDVNGIVDTVNVKDTLGYSSESMPYLWLNIKHPIPVLPNLRLEYVNVNSSGNSGSFSWEGNPVPTGTKSELTLTQYDAVLYYNLLDNTFWTTLDLGLDVKMIQSNYTIAPQIGFGGYAGYNESKDVVVPMAYLRGRVEIPATNFGFEADVKYIGDGTSEISDIRLKADYTLDFVPVVQPALEVGYRIQKFKLQDNSNDVKTDLNYSGVYVGLMLRF